MMTGIIGAMSVETDALKAIVNNATKETVSGVEFVRGTVNGHEVVVAQCGIGKVFAAICAQTMILRYGVDQIINTGVAGTLCDELGLLDIAISTAVVEHDMDTSPLGDPVGLISGINIVEIPAAKKLAAKIADAAADLKKKTALGIIASGDQFISDTEKKAYIRNTFHAIACEMEGAAIGHVCYVNDVAFAVIRCISDNADSEAGTMEYPELCRRAAKQSQELIKKFFEI
ncbi:MAG: 5'-methylthioadenosine/adenosylhomocysteine nucleosidase [Clostridia bacterium]|nr:5'-methylthioadenosine/adenosylhomocysteine nucleosidase [Clostridia bacterium]